MLDTKIKIKRVTSKHGKINLHDYEYYAVVQVGVQPPYIVLNLHSQPKLSNIQKEFMSNDWIRQSK